MRCGGEDDDGEECGNIGEAADSGDFLVGADELVMACWLVQSTTWPGWAIMAGRLSQEKGRWRARLEPPLLTFWGEERGEEGRWGLMAEQMVLGWWERRR